MNDFLFKKWLQFFTASIGDNIKRPVVLVFDGLKSHYSADIVHMGASLGIILLCLPANATHLYQPFDICVFGPFKDLVRELIFDYMVQHGTKSNQK